VQMGFGRRHAAFLCAATVRASRIFRSAE
jgi:hypothetical protein